MLGYGAYHYRVRERAGGRHRDRHAREPEELHLGYVMCVDEALGKYVAEKHADRLGKASVGKSCIRFKRLEDVNLDAMAEVLREAASTMASAAQYCSVEPKLM